MFDRPRPGDVTGLANEGHEPTQDRSFFDSTRIASGSSARAANKSDWSDPCRPRSACARIHALFLCLDHCLLPANIFSNSQINSRRRQMLDQG